MFDKIFKFTKNIFDVFLEIIFPRCCIVCKKEGEYICTDCLKTVKFLHKQFCPCCRSQNNFGEFCSLSCRRNFYFKSVIVCAKYEKQSVLKKLIVHFKYKFSREVCAILGEILKTQIIFLAQSPVFRKEITEAVFVPVPLNKSRMKFRGFNQAKMLAEYLVKSLKNEEIFGKFFRNISLAEVLECKNKFDYQAKLSRADRLKNLQNSFFLNAEYKKILSLKNKTIILVDDVATTLTTLNECAKILKKISDNEIIGLVLARG